MEYVFGSTLVCETAEAAKRVTFDPSVRMKSVTLEGDVYDPSGTLSGGSSPSSSGVLVIMQKLSQINKEMGELQSVMAKERKKLESAKKTKQEFDLKTHEIQLTEEQINGNSSSSVSISTEMRR